MTSARMISITHCPVLVAVLAFADAKMALVLMMIQVVAIVMTGIPVRMITVQVVHANILMIILQAAALAYQGPVNVLEGLVSIPRQHRGHRVQCRPVTRSLPVQAMVSL